jgi:hypothetical protein
MIMSVRTGRRVSEVAANVANKIANLKTEKPKSSKEKWQMPLTEEAEKNALRWINAKTVSEPIEENLQRAKDDFNEYASKYMANKLFETKSRPSNPLVVIKKENGDVDHQFQFMMVDKFKYRFPNCPDDVETREHFIGVFESIGLHPQDAENLVDNEIDLNPMTGIKSLTTLLEGHYGSNREWIDSSDEEKTVGEKLANMIFWDGKSKLEPFTESEQAMIIERDPGVQVKSGFLDRVATYCQSLDQLLAIFSVIQPIFYPSYAKFAVNDDQKIKTNRLIEAASCILGSNNQDN